MENMIVGIRKPIVTVHGRELRPGPSQKLRNHSPSGFEWGYGGSGPSQLAMAILLEVTGDKDVTGRHYQAFKNDFVSLFPHECFALTVEEVNIWLAAQMSKARRA